MNIDTWQEIFATLRSNKLRTFLTALGVFWGIFMLVVMLGAGQGLENNVKKDMGGFSTNAIYVWGQRTSMPHEGLQPGRYVQFENDDIEMIRQNVPDIEYFAPRLQLGGWRGGDNVNRKGKTGDFNVNGDVPDFQHIQTMEFDKGRFINELDIRDSRKVCVIGPRIYETLYERGEEPIGSHLKIKGVYFTVVGLFKPSGTGHRNERLAATIFIPFSTFQSAFNQGNRVNWFAITVPEGKSTDKVEDEVRAVLSKRHKINPNDKHAFGSFNMGKKFGEISMIFVAIKLLVLVVGLLTLLAGILGVSNIMLIIIKERTKEIGIKKAVGATPWSITSQIIQESTALTAVAGYCGLTAGVIALEVLSKAAGDQLLNPQVDMKIALYATAILIVCGALAGLIPARNAVRVNTVEALRAE